MQGKSFADREPLGGRLAEEPGMTLFHRVAPAISKDGCGPAAMWEKTHICVDAPHFVVIKH